MKAMLHSLLLLLLGIGIAGMVGSGLIALCVWLREWAWARAGHYGWGSISQMNETGWCATACPKCSSNVADKNRKQYIAESLLMAAWGTDEEGVRS